MGSILYRKSNIWAIMLFFVPMVIWGAEGKGDLHKKGNFYFRVSLGYGYSDGTLKLDAGGALKPAPGLASAFDLQMGYSFAPKWVVFGQVTGAGKAASPLYLDGNKIILEQKTFNFPAVAAGVSYYIMPVNFHFSSMLRVNQLVFETRNPANDFVQPYISGFGLGIGLSAGWEFFTGKGWATGVEATFTYDLPGLSGKGIYNTISVFYAGLAWTVTYN